MQSVMKGPCWQKPYLLQLLASRTILGIDSQSAGRERVVVEKHVGDVREKALKWHESLPCTFHEQNLVTWPYPAARENEN